MSEKMLIDARPILQDFIKIADRSEGKNPYENVKIKAYRRCFERVADAPKVDAVEVVRCGDPCRYYKEYLGKDTGKPCGYGSCQNARFFGSMVFDEDFCSLGERKGK